MRESHSFVADFAWGVQSVWREAVQCLALQLKQGKGG